MSRERGIMDSEINKNREAGKKKKQKKNSSFCFFIPIDLTEKWRFNIDAGLFAV